MKIVGQVDNLRADCQSAQPGNARPVEAAAPQTEHVTP